MKLTILGIVFILGVIALAVHQFIYYGMWFAIEDLHHETWMIMLAFAGGLLLFIGKGKR